MCDNTNPSTQSIADYLAQLLKDRKQLAAFPNVFMHMERLLDEGTSTSNTTINKTSANHPLARPIARSCQRNDHTNGFDVKYSLTRY